MPEPDDVSSPSDRALGVRRLRGPSGDTWTEPDVQPGSVPYLRETALMMQAYPTTSRQFRDEANALEIKALRELLAQAERERDALAQSVSNLAGVRVEHVLAGVRGK